MATPNNAAEGEPDFEGVTPLAILDWLGANPQVSSGWAEDFRRELSGQRDVDAVMEEERERN